MDPAIIIERLHASEISGTLSWPPDGEWQWHLGHELSGVDGAAATLEDAVLAMAEAARAEYPGSVFARWWRERRAGALDVALKPPAR
jgi:hypothetical protein